MKISSNVSIPLPKAVGGTSNIRKLKRIEVDEDAPLCLKFVCNNRSSSVHYLRGYGKSAVGIVFHVWADAINEKVAFVVERR